MNSDLEKLGEKLDRISAQKSEETEAEKRQYENAENMGRGIRAGAELISPIVAAAFLGWLLDGWLGTKPLFLIILLLLGVTTGFINVWRMTRNIGSSVGYSELHRREKDAKNAPAKKGASE